MNPDQTAREQSDLGPYGLQCKATKVYKQVKEQTTIVVNGRRRGKNKFLHNKYLCIAVKSRCHIKKNHVQLMFTCSMNMVLTLKIPLKCTLIYLYDITMNRDRSGSVVECLTRDRRAAGSSLTGVTALWSLSKTHLS